MASKPHKPGLTPASKRNKVKGKNNAKKTRVTKVVKTEVTTVSNAVPVNTETANPTETKSSEPKSELVNAVTQALKVEAPLLDLRPALDPVTPEARKWLQDPTSIPGPDNGKRFAPIRYTGWAVIAAFANVLNRPLNLNEVQVLVEPDGDVETCAVDNIPFQPVRYIPFVAKAAENALVSGKSMLEAPHYRGGAFFLLKGEAIAFSGSVYDGQGLNKTSNSPLVMAARQAAKVANKKGEIWGVERSRAVDHIRFREERQAESNRRHRRVEELFSQGPRKSKPLPIPDEQRRQLDQLKLVPAGAGSNGNGSRQ